MPDASAETLLALTVEIAVAHVGNNHLAVADVPTLIETIHASLAGLHAPIEGAIASPELPAATTVRKSLANPDHIISLIDGKPYKLLKRHLHLHGLTPDQYRARYGLKPDYPMTAAVYSKRRSELAKANGLGRIGKTKPRSGSAATEPGRRGRKPATEQ